MLQGILKFCCFQTTFKGRYLNCRIDCNTKSKLNNVRLYCQISEANSFQNQQDAEEFLEQLDKQKRDNNNYYNTQSSEELQPGLYIVSTPIGHLEDITLRALNTLKNVNGILAEDTRRSGILLQKYRISKPMVSYHVFNEKARSYQIVKRLERGESLALISDAGTPGISDPGERLIESVLDSGIKIIPIPGACAPITGLVASGLPTEQFYFAGFLPSKQIARRKKLESLAWIEATLIFFLPARELLDGLGDMAEALGKQRRCCVAREMTKIYEDFYRGTLFDATHKFTDEVLRGEVTVLVEGRTLQTDLITDYQLEMELTQLLQQGTLASVAAKQLAHEHGISKRKIYQLATKLKHQELIQNQSPPDLIEE